MGETAEDNAYLITFRSNVIFSSDFRETYGPCLQFYDDM
jgi:hypothetical protein